MNFGKISVIVILILVLGFGAVLLYKKSQARWTQKNKVTTVLGEVNENWSVFSNDKYGYEVWCPNEFDCRYTCSGSYIENEQFCANAKTDDSQSLYLSQQAASKTNYGLMVISAFDSSFKVSSNNKKILDEINKKMDTLETTKLDSSKYNITGVDRLDGYIVNHNETDKVKSTEEWFFVKNDLLYQATIKYEYNNSNKEQNQKLVDVLHNIFGTVSF